MSDAHMVSKIAWMIHGECMEWIENEDDYKKAARKLIEIVRRHDKRLTKRAADLPLGVQKIKVLRKRQTANANR